MKKVIAIYHSPRTSDFLLKTILPQGLNVLGDMNRNRSPEDTTTIVDGTPPTQPCVNMKILSELGIPDFQSEIYEKMTYGPAAGFPFAIDAVKRLSEIQSIIGQAIPILHGGNKTATSVANRACQSITGKPFVTIQGLSERNPTHSPKRFTIGARTLQDVLMNSDTKSEIIDFLKNGNNLVVTLDDYLPAQESPLKLSVELIGNAQIAQQMITTIGYIGPILEPHSQFIFSHASQFKRPLTSLISTPPLTVIQTEFLDYFNSETLCHLPLENSRLVSGGCSGGLFNIAQSLEAPKTLIPTPFFPPQKGILEAAGQEVACKSSFTELSAHITRDTNVLLTFPNNPDDSMPSPEELSEIIQKVILNKTTLIIDATYFNVIRAESQNKFHALMGLLTSTPDLNWTCISSASKALALTKFRAEFISGDEKTLQRADSYLEPIDSLTAIALHEGLKIKNRTRFKEKLIQNVNENQKYLSQILDQTLDERITQTLNIGLQKLSTIVKTLYQENPSAPKLTVDTGDGALYAKLSVPEEHKQNFHRHAEHQHLALTPGEIFYGTPYSDSLTPLRTPQDWYRLSLMADPTH